MAQDPQSEAAILRQKAEELLSRNPLKSAAPKNEAELRKLIHELEVHQIELELQHEELVLAKEQSEFSFQKYKDSMPSEEELHENRLRLELAMRAANMAWWKIELTTGCVTFGRRKAEMLGYPPEKFSHYTDFTALLHPEDFERTMKAMQDHLNGSVDKYEVEYRMLTQSNGYQWFYDIGSVVKKDSNGNPLILTGLVLDIGDRKQSEESLLASETRYRRLFESAKDGILILDAETGMITDVNPYLIEMSRYSKDQFLHKAIWEIEFFKDIVANQDKFIELQQKENVRYDDLLLETCDGRKISAEFVSNVYLVDHKKVIQCEIRDITTRKKTEMALRMSETHLRTLVQSIPDLIWLKDPEGVYLSCNPMFERFFGAKEADIIGKTDYDFVDRELADFFRENDRKAMAAGKPTSNEEWITFVNDDHRVYLETIKTPIIDPEGKLIGVLGTGRDITERKLTEERLRESEERFRAIFDQAPIAIALMDMQGRPVISNLPFSKMLGYNSDVLTKMTFTEFTYPEDIDKDIIQFTDLLAGKISGYTMEKRYIHKNGDLIWANLFVTTLSDHNGMLKEIISMVEDITEKKLAETKLRNSEERFKIIFDYAPDVYFLTDLKGTIIDGNIAAVQLMGYDKNELIGKNFFKLKLIAPNQFLKAAALLAKNLVGIATGPDEFVLNQKNGSKVLVEISTYPVKIQDQNIVLGIARDISGRK